MKYKDPARCACPLQDERNRGGQGTVKIGATNGGSMGFLPVAAIKPLVLHR